MSAEILTDYILVMLNPRLPYPQGLGEIDDLPGAPPIIDF